jgi:glycosyltransferase involved in cell wall biosynthesis
MSDAKVPFSVIIPLYNKAATVERALRSILNQTVQDFEIIVVNDGSTDDSANVVAAINDSRIRIIHQVNQGVSAARNSGIAEARNELIAFLDADDEWMPVFLETIRRMVIRYPDCGLYATRYYIGIDLIKKRMAILNGLSFEYEGILQQYFNVALVSEPPLWSSAVVVRKSAFYAIGGFPIGIRIGEDLLTWAKLAINFPIAYSAKPLAFFRQAKWHLYESFPQRLPDIGDPVGNALNQLLHNCPPAFKSSLRKYIALWHKMRLSLFVRADMKKESFSAWFSSVIYNPFQWKIHGLIVTTVLGRRIRNILFFYSASNSRKKI